MFPWRSSQCRHGSCAVDEKIPNQQNSYCPQLAFILVIFYLFCSHVLVPDHKKPSLLLAGVCSDWTEAVARCWDQQLSCRWQVMVGSSPVPFLQVHCMTEEWERIGICEKGENVHVKGRRSHRRARGCNLPMEVSVGYCLPMLCCSGRGNTTVRKDKWWFPSGCPSWEEQKTLKHGQSRRIISFPSCL